VTSLNVSERLERLFRRAGLAFALVALVLTGCGKSADEYMRHAQTLLDSGSIPAAIVELKNVLQREPKNVTARLLLGKSYLELGDAASAEIELQHAREDGATPAALGQLMAETELVLGKLDGALRESAIRPDATPALKASLYAIQGLANLGQGKAAAADEALAAGLRQDPRSTDVLAALARYALTRRDIASARQRVDDALTIAPADVHLMALKGTVAFLGRDFITAEESFAHVLKVQP
jgi:cellulose synthase operon protein C